jgi:hypothetical protein
LRLFFDGFVVLHDFGAILWCCGCGSLVLYNDRSRAG